MSKDKKPLAMPTAQEQEALFKSNKVISLDMPVNQPVNEITRLIEDLQKSADKTVRSSKAVQLALDTDPVKDNSSFSSLYKRKESLLPTEILKRIRDTEELIGGIILPIRARQVASFARPRANRFDVGFTINLKPEIISKYSEDQQEQIKLDIIPKLRETLVNCGSNTGIIDRNKRNLTQLFMEIVEDILTFGAFAIEVRKDAKGNFHSFRAIDAGTIHFINPKTTDSAADQVRKEAIRMLSELSGMQSEAKKFENEEYTYVQVIDGVPRQVFTDEELIYWSAAPSTDINRSGYPITPIERIVNAVTMHINLTTQNKLYFVNGRAAKNVIVFKSDNLEAEDIAAIKNQMSAHINSVGASHRIPVFGLGVNDEFNIVPMESGGRDMEFQYLADLNKRMIFAAYQMSPDEVAALSYLSRGTNSQAMSESNNEYKLEASRSSGLRPLLISLEDFLNERLLPKINNEWSNLVMINIEGLDADSPEKEATRLQQDIATHSTMNEIMARVEKEVLPIGGEFPLNAAYLQLLEKYYTKGQILKAFGGDEFKNADQDPQMQYYMGDPVWLQMQQMQMQQQQAQQQMQMQQQQAQQDPGQMNSEHGEDVSKVAEGDDLDSALGQLQESLSKSENVLPKARKEMLKKFKVAKGKIMKEYAKSSKNAMKELLSNLEKSEMPHICTEDCDHSEE